VWRYLVQRGVPAHRLRVRNFGPERPAEPNDSPEGREKNRRVEVLLTLPHP
jgi:flagellar motor protein MotB